MKPVRLKSLSLATGLALASVAMQGIAAFAAPAHAGATAAATPAAASEVYIITFAEAGLLNYEGGVSGFARTAPDAARGQRLDRDTLAARSYEAYLAAQRELHRGAIEVRIGRRLATSHSYGITFNGIAAALDAAEVAAIATLPGVESVRPAGVYHLDTYRGPAFIGADQVWNGHSTPNLVGNRGEGIKVGIIDSGSNATHPSFANDPTCGFSVLAPKLVAVDCSGSSGDLCNGSVPEANPGNGHGVHTAGTVAGNTIDNTATPPPALLAGTTMSGVAPCAKIYSYKVCETNSCSGAAIAAATENAIADGVDVINFSISGGTSPWIDNDRAFLDAVGAGTFVAASAGNTSVGVPDPVAQVNHRGPWVLTVAASTHDQIVGPGFSLSGPGTPPPLTRQVALSPGSTTQASSTPTWAGKPVKTYPANIEGCTAAGGIPAGTFSGSVAVLRRGTCTFVEKISNAFGAGADMVVIGNNQFGSLNMDTTDAPAVPAYGMSQANGDAIIAFVGAHSADSTADVVPILATERQGDVLASFSFRGPTPAPLADLTKPDVTAPGVDIYAASDADSGQYERMSGTSMSGPHVAGAAALVKAVHPDWTPVEIRSALMMSAKLAGFREDGTSAWSIDDTGSGRVQVDQAVLAGLTMDETKANFIAANPAGGSLDVKQLNLPSLRNMACHAACTWTRTVRNRLATNGSWAITGITDPAFTVGASPASFTLAPGAEQTITFSATPLTAIGAVAFGNVFLTETGNASPPQHITVAIKGDTGATYTVGGTVGGLVGSGLVLSLNGGAQSLAVAANGSFVFPNGLPGGATYAVTVDAQPEGQVCSVANGSGTIAGANVDNVSVTCVVALNYTVGGTVSNLIGNGLVLSLNDGAQLLPIAANGAFTFPVALIDGSSYFVSIDTQPSVSTCFVANAMGMIAGADVDNVMVFCHDRIFADDFEALGRHAGH